jgi:hypothetical protein
VRHAERADNGATEVTNTSWTRDTVVNPLGLHWDNPPLSRRGQELQADKLAARY